MPPHEDRPRRIALCSAEILLAHLRDDIPLCTGRTSAAAAALGTRIYVIGGIDPADSTYLSSAEEYDTETDHWSTIAPMNTVRMNHMAAAIGTRIYVMGGSDGRSYLDSTEVYNSEGDNWSAVASMDIAREGGAAAAVGTRIYV
eukprot:SAG22_NODE_5821_length_947_cov_1.174528_2_plen_143_part_01